MIDRIIRRHPACCIALQHVVLCSIMLYSVQHAAIGVQSVQCGVKGDLVIDRFFIVLSGKFVVFQLADQANSNVLPSPDIAGLNEHAKTVRPPMFGCAHVACVPTTLSTRCTSGKCCRLRPSSSPSRSSARPYTSSRHERSGSACHAHAHALAQLHRHRRPRSRAHAHSR